MCAPHVICNILEGHADLSSETKEIVSHSILNGQKCSKRHLKLFNSCLSKKIRLDASCESSA